MKTSIFFIISILSCALAFGQEENDQDTVKVPAKFLSGISVTADIGKLAVGQMVDYEDKKAFSAHILFLNNYQVSAEYGFGTIAPEDAFDNIAYTSEGNYNRFGIDYVKKIKTKNFISFGIRKASAEFSDEGTVFIRSASPLSADYTRSYSRNSVSANWWEVVIASETKLTADNTGKEISTFQAFMDNFYFGLKFRVRFLLDYPIPEGIDVYTIPGYGRTFDSSVPAVNLYLRYRLDFK